MERDSSLFRGKRLVISVSAVCFVLLVGSIAAATYQSVHRKEPSSYSHEPSAPSDAYTQAITKDVSGIIKEVDADVQGPQVTGDSSATRLPPAVAGSEPTVGTETQPSRDTSVFSFLKKSEPVPSTDISQPSLVSTRLPFFTKRRIIIIVIVSLVVALAIAGGLTYYFVRKRQLDLEAMQAEAMQAEAMQATRDIKPVIHGDYSELQLEAMRASGEISQEDLDASLASGVIRINPEEPPNQDLWPTFKILLWVFGSVLAGLIIFLLAKWIKDSVFS